MARVLHLETRQAESADSCTLGGSGGPKVTTVVDLEDQPGGGNRGGEPLSWQLKITKSDDSSTLGDHQCVFKNQPVEDTD